MACKRRSAQRHHQGSAQEGRRYRLIFGGRYGRSERDPHRYKYSYDPYFLYRADTFNPDIMSGEYSDRMWEWDHDKFDRCVNAVWPDSRHGQCFYHDDPEDVKKFLELYFGHPVVLHGILQGCNVSSGYPYWIFVFTKVEI